MAQRIEMDTKPKDEKGLEDDETEDSARPLPTRLPSKDPSHLRDANGLKKILFW